MAGEDICGAGATDGAVGNFIAFAVGGDGVFGRVSGAEGCKIVAVAGGDAGGTTVTVSSPPGDDGAPPIPGVPGSPPTITADEDRPPPNTAINTTVSPITTPIRIARIAA